MPAGQNISQMQFDPLPLPDDTPVKGEEERQNARMQQASRLPPGAGFMPKAGGVAYLANQLLTGWMAGRHVKAERQLNKAKDDVTQSRSIYDSLAASYSEKIASGKSKDDPEMQEMAKTITTAWGNYVNTADKYTAPPEEAGKGKKKSLGSRIAGGTKKALMTNTDPELYRSASVNILRQSGPPVLRMDATPQQKLENAQANEGLQAVKDRNRWGELAQMDPAKRTKEQTDELEGLERKLHPETTEQATRDSILKKVMGGTALSKEERQLGESFGFLKAGVTSTLQWKDEKGVDWMIQIGPDGQEVGRRQIGKGYIAPDQGAVAERVFQTQVNAMVAEYKRAYGDQYTDPKKLDVEAHRFALMTVAGVKGNPAMQERDQFVLDKALRAVVGEDKEKKAVYGNFIVSPQDDPNGLYFYRTNLVDPQTPEKEHWFWANDPAKYYGGVTKDELPGLEKEFRDRLRTALKKQNPKMSDDQINALMPPSIYSEGGPGTKQPAGNKSLSMDKTPDESKTIASDTIRALAKSSGVPYDVAVKQFEAAGYKVK